MGLGEREELLYLSVLIWENRIGESMSGLGLL
jgi:hypothetical protein